MREKLKDDKKARDLLFKFLTLVVVVALVLLFYNVATQSKDGRTQIVDEDGGEEYLTVNGRLSSREELRLEQMLSLIKGVGEVSVMITWQEAEETLSAFSPTVQQAPRVKGVIVAAQGADSAVVQNSIISAVASVYSISTKNIMVFQREDETNGGYQLENQKIIQ